MCRTFGTIWKTKKTLTVSAFSTLEMLNLREKLAQHRALPMYGFGMVLPLVKLVWANK